MKLKHIMAAGVAALGITLILPHTASAQNVNCSVKQRMPHVCGVTVTVPKVGQGKVAQNKKAAREAARPIVQRHLASLDPKYAIKGVNIRRFVNRGDKVEATVNYSIRLRGMNMNQIKQRTANQGSVVCDNYENGKVFRCFTKVEDGNFQLGNSHVFGSKTQPSEGAAQVETSVRMDKRVMRDTARAQFDAHTSKLGSGYFRDQVSPIAEQGRTIHYQAYFYKR